MFALLFAENCCDSVVHLTQPPCGIIAQASGKRVRVLLTQRPVRLVTDGVCFSREQVVLRGASLTSFENRMLHEKNSWEEPRTKISN